MIEPRMRERAISQLTSAAGKLSIGSLAKATGVPVETLRTWEQRYGFPVAERKPSGHRVYALSNVVRLRRIADAIARGHRAGAVVGATDAELDRLLSATAPPPAAAPLPANPSQPSIDELLAAVETFDADRLTAALWSDWGRLGPIGFVQQTVAPLIERVGLEWEQGRMEIRHEHFLSERLGDVMRAIRLPLDLSSAGPTVICATLPGESHAIGLQMAALLLSSAGLRVLYLGTGMPPPELGRLARELGARAVAISVSAAADGAEVERHLTALREALPRQAQLLVGGRGAPAARAGIVTFDGFAALVRWAQSLRA
ncbi:MAG: cobalamin-binding protein [Acidobacteria bacterium]|nr:cobalamin-binding protein [Acidobacteriota bacterium]